MGNEEIIVVEVTRLAVEVSSLNLDTGSRVVLAHSERSVAGIKGRYVELNLAGFSWSGYLKEGDLELLRLAISSLLST